MRCVLLLSIGLGLFGCAKAADTGNPFGGATAALPSNDGDSDDTDSDTDANDTDVDDGDAGTGGISASGGSDSDTSADDSTTTDDPSTTDDNTTGTTDDSTSTSTSTTGQQAGPGQPMTGMYSHCDDVDGMMSFPNCIAGATTCINNVSDGFCTAQGCLDPMVDCDDAPTDSDAAPICMTDLADSVAFCALDCSAGQTCPAGMSCVTDVTLDDSMSVFSICI